ncbi:MAG TPA: response regulator transcription factor [Flavisolibacter sp.]|nr:response regulator transcription factor [Flavisolibacter sp.]
MKILIIEDEPEMLQTLVGYLQSEHYVVETATDVDSALEKVGVYEYDCILLDIMLNGQNGLDVLRALKKEGKSDGVIIISAKDAIDDKIAGLDLGADDYLPKPFHLAELHARVKSIIRRKKFTGSSMLQVANLSVNLDLRTISIDDIVIPLNRKEYDILLYLLTNKDRLVAKTALAEHVWGDRIDEADSFEFIYSQIKNIRKKLKDSNAQIEIQAIYGIGYRLAEL